MSDHTDSFNGSPKQSTNFITEKSILTDRSENMLLRTCTSLPNSLNSGTALPVDSEDVPLYRSQSLSSIVSDSDSDDMDGLLNPFQDTRHTYVLEVDDKTEEDIRK